MNTSSGGNDPDKRDQPEKSFPINLTGAKLNVKTPDLTKNSVILGAQGLRTLNQSHMRVIANAVPTASISTSSSSGQAIISTIMPQTMLKQGSHVPCGPAAVASIAVPRGATPIRGITVSQPGTVRQLVPPRTPSPGNVIHTGSTWPVGTTLQVQTTGTVGLGSTKAQNPLLVTPPRAITSTLPLIQGRSNIARSNISSNPRPAVLHTAPLNVQTYKPVQSLGTSLTVTQVGTKPGPAIVYTAVTSGQHLPQTQRLSVTSPRQISNNRTVSIASSNTARLGQNAVLAGGRLAVVVSNTTQPFNQSNVSSGNKLNHSIQITQVPQGQGSKLTAQLQQHQAIAVAPAATVIPVTVTVTPSSRQATITAQPLRFGPIYVERSGFQTGADPNAAITQSPSESQIQVQSIGKQTSSPRPSILRKREIDTSTLKAAKNLTPVLSSLSASCLPPVSPPSRPDSRGTGQSSAGSTTISATSSPGPDESPSPPTNLNPSSGLHSRPIDDNEDARPPIEMSPRKKPRKQQLGGNDLQQSRFEIQFPSDRVKEENPEPKRTVPRTPTEVTVKKPVPASLLNSYHQTWKSTHNHFVRYTDVKPKEERPPSIVDIANQNRILQKVKGWKIYHLTAQMEDLSDFEMQAHSKLGSLLKKFDLKDYNDGNRDLERIADLIKGNMQRSKIINDGMLDAKVQVMKIFDHKAHATDIISRCASKRNYKKREKS